MTQYELESEIVRRDIELRHQRERVERLEALLRESYRVVGDTDSSVLAKIKLLAKIKEVLG